MGQVTGTMVSTNANTHQHLLLDFLIPFICMYVYTHMCAHTGMLVYIHIATDRWTERLTFRIESIRPMVTGPPM